jgi:antitoxin MazE
MTTTIRKWGNSLGMRIPKNIAEQMELRDGSQISINMNKDSLEITKVQENNELDSLLLAITKENIHSEVTENSAMGNEIW